MNNTTALVPAREESIRFVITNINRMPIYNDAAYQLNESVKKEKLDDFHAEFKNLSMSEYGFLTYNDLNLQYTKHALTQAVSRIKPDGVVGLAGYLAVCPPGLRADNYNYWHADRYENAVFSTKGNNVILRVKAGEHGFTVLRAVTGQNYSLINDTDVLDTLSGIITDKDNCHVMSYRGDVKSRYMMFWPTRHTKLSTNDEIMVALKVVNSETCASSIRLEPVVYHVGTNSCLSLSSVSKDVTVRHVGEAKSRLDRAYKYIVDNMSPFIERLDESYSDVVDAHFKSVEQMLQCVSAEYLLTEKQIAAVHQALPTNVNLARSHVATALASTATNCDLDTADELQRVAGLIVTRGWTPIKKHIGTNNE